jgi:hypothetical protein
VKKFLFANIKMTDSYCVKCRKHTPSTNATISHVSKGKNAGAPYERSQCTVCGTTKCKFLPRGTASGSGAKRGKGIFSFLGL